MDVEILLFEGFDELDAVGPYEVFQSAGDRGADVTARYVTLKPVDWVAASHGTRIQPDGVLSQEAPDLLVVPGGGWNDRDGPGVWSEYRRGDVPEAVAAIHSDGSTVASVCTGAMLLSKAGLLSERPATTHHTAITDLRETDADVREARYVDDGDVLTAAGVTAGLDLALHVVEREFVGDVADAVARELEYERAI